MLERIRFLSKHQDFKSVNLAMDQEGRPSLAMLGSIARRHLALAFHRSTFVGTSAGTDEMPEIEVPTSQKARLAWHSRTSSPGKYWRMDYRLDGKAKTLALGIYPEVTLAEARQRRQSPQSAGKWNGPSIVY